VQLREIQDQIRQEYLKWSTRKDSEVTNKMENTEIGHGSIKEAAQIEMDAEFTKENSPLLDEKGLLLLQKLV
jgi:hypothetical protein